MQPLVRALARVRNHQKLERNLKWRFNCLTKKKAMDQVAQSDEIEALFVQSAEGMA